MNPISRSRPGPSQQAAADIGWRPANAKRTGATVPVGSSILAGLRPLPARADAGHGSPTTHTGASLGEPVPEEAMPLAGYLLARRLDRRPVLPEGIAVLGTADKAVSDARRALPFGRGNVDADIRQSIHESEMRVIAAQEMGDEMLKLGQPVVPDEEANFVAISAATARAFGAGNCDEYAASAALSYGSRALAAGRPPGEEVHVVRHGIQEHKWAEAYSGEAPPVVMDAWAQGPAVFAEDSWFGKDRSLVGSTAAFDLPNAGLLDQVVETGVEEIKQAGPDVLRAWLEKAQAIMADPREGRFAFWRPQPVLDDAFAERVRDRLQTNDHKKAVQVELEAVGVAMSLGSGKVPDLVDEASKIVDQAKSLVARPRRPADQRG